MISSFHSFIGREKGKTERGGVGEMLFQGSSFCQDSLGSGWALGISVEGMRGGEGGTCSIQI